AGRMPLDHAEIRQVCLRVADEEVVNVVLPGVDARRERRPRGRRLGRVRRPELLQTAAALRELRDVRQLAFVHPFLHEARVHAVEAEDDELLVKLLGRTAASARAGETEDGRGEENPLHKRSGRFAPKAVRRALAEARGEWSGRRRAQVIVTSAYARSR